MSQTNIKTLTQETRVAVVHDWIFERRGGEKVLERILNLFPQAHLYYLFGKPLEVLKINHKPKCYPSFLNKIPFIQKIYKTCLPLLPIAIESFDFSNYDIIISTSSCVAKGIIPPPNSKHISYIHSPMRYIWDQEHNYFKNKPSFFRPLEILRRLFLNYLRIWDVTSSARIDKLIANSQFVARRCQLYYGKSSTVIYPPVQVAFFAEKIKSLREASSRRPFFNETAKIKEEDETQNQPQATNSTETSENKLICEPKKVLLFGAWVPYKKMYETLCFLVENNIPVIAAGHGADLLKSMKKFSGKVEFFYSPKDEDIPDLFSKAHVLLFPAIEDFGIVPLEATSCGLWVVAPNSGGTQETVLHGKTGFTFQEGNYQDMLEALNKSFQKQFYKEDYDDMKNHANKFSPENFDLNLLSVVSQSYIHE